MKAGALTRRVALFRRVQDGPGHATGELQPMDPPEVMGDLQQGKGLFVTGRKFYAGAELVAEDSDVIVIRYRRDVEQEEGEIAAVIDGVKYDVQRVQDTGDRPHRELSLLCRKGLLRG